MAYYIVREGTGGWRLMYRKGTVRRTVPKTSTEALEAGFQRGFGLEEAKGRANQLRSEAWAKRHAERAYRESQLTIKVQAFRNAFLREEDVVEFERTYLTEKRIRPTHWRTAQKVIYATELHPSDWFERPSVVYEQLAKRGLSRTYAQKLRRILNLWGYFLCKKQGRAWKDLEAPSTYWKVKLVDIKRHTPIPLSALECASLPEEERRWAERCFWFGLRPQECDRLTDSAWACVVEAEGLTWLDVLQVKLLERGVPEAKAWKRIPVWTAEQKRLVSELELPAKRPTLYAFRRAFGAGFTPYGLRQGFSEWLRDQPEVDLERRSAYLGHLSTRTTDRSYTDKTKRLAPKKTTGERS